MKKVLVLCTGNSARSQIAEAYLKFYARGHGIFFSAGLENHGMHPLAVQAMEEDNIDLRNHFSKTVDVFANVAFDYLITVCDASDDPRVAALSSARHIHFDIPDPALFEGSDEERLQQLRKVRELIKCRMLKFIGQELLSGSKAVA